MAGHVRDAPKEFAQKKIDSATLNRAMANTQTLDAGAVIKSVTVYFPDGSTQNFDGDRVITFATTPAGLLLTVKHEINEGDSVDIVGLPMSIVRGAAVVRPATRVITFP